MVVVKIEGEPYLCKTDEVGELCVSSGYTGGYYWGLKGFSNNAFRVSRTALNCRIVCCRVVDTAVVKLWQELCPRSRVANVR